MSAPAAALRIGTRGSPLALRQAELVAGAIAGPVETVVLRTGGDRGEGVDKRRWVDAIEAALLDGSIDLAVHSAKDVPAALADGLEIVAAPRRADPRDAICGAASLWALPPGARVGTSSLRRSAQLRALREDLDVLPLHGNLDTRLARLAGGDYDAIVLAVAGLSRLGRDGWSALDELVPAAGQGTLALEARAGDERVRAAVEGLRDEAAERALAAERAMVARLGAGCDTPVGAFARSVGRDDTGDDARSAGEGRGDCGPQSDGEGRGGRSPGGETSGDRSPGGDRSPAGGTGGGGADGASEHSELELDAFIGAPDGSHWIRDRARGGDPAALGEAVAERLLRAGAGALLG